MGASPAVWTDAVIRRLWRDLLHADWLPCSACLRCRHLAAHHPCHGQAPSVHAATTCRGADLRHLLVLCRRLMAGSVWHCVSLLKRLVVISVVPQTRGRQWPCLTGYPGEEDASDAM